MALKLDINGATREFDGDGDMPLLWYLRDHAQLTGTKFGCGAGYCGACTVLVDGQAQRSCLLPVRALAGKEIMTIEGLSADGSHPVQQAWLAEDVPQCGYCQAGQVLSAVALLQRSPQPSDAEIESSTNLCRCGTYVRIRRAIRRAASGIKR